VERSHADERAPFRHGGSNSPPGLLRDPKAF